MNKEVSLLSLNCAKKSEVIDSIFSDAPSLPHILHLQEPPLSDLPCPNTFEVFTPLTFPHHFRAVTYVHKSLLVVAQSDTCASADVVCLDIQTPAGVGRFVNAYNDRQTDSAIALLSQKLPESTIPGGGLFISGDFNVEHPWWSGTSRQLSAAHVRRAEPLTDVMVDLGLDLLFEPGSPTSIGFQRERTPTTIDLCLASGLLLDHALSCTPSTQQHGSDHLAYETTFSLQTSSLPRADRLNYRQTDWNMYRSLLTRDLEGLRLLEAKNGTTTTGLVDARADTLHSTVMGCLAASTPLSRVSPYSNPWWTPELSTAKKRFRKVLRAARSARFEGDAATDFQIERRSYNRAIKLAKRAFWENTLQHTTQDQLWQSVRLVKGQTKRRSIPPLKNGTGQLCNQPGDKAELLTRSLFPKISTVPPLQPPTLERERKWHASLQHKSPRKAHTDITEAEVKTALETTQSLSAHPSESFPAQALKEGWVILGSHVTDLYNACLQLSHHPEPWKHAQVVPVPKPRKKDLSDTGSYRPIALLHVLSKAMEKVLATRLIYYGLHGSLPPEHFGALPGRSVQHALLNLEAIAKTKMQQGYSVCAIATDFKGAFDRVPHEVLLATLRRRGIPRRVVKWLTAFLTSRSCSLSVDGSDSIHTPLERGVPQGSPLSPILFLFYTSSLLELLRTPHSQTVAWLDDTTLLVWDKDLRLCAARANELLASASWWSRYHGAVFEPGKSFYMFFDRRKRTKSATEMPHLYLSGEAIKPTRVMRVLGYLLTPSFSPVEHVHDRVDKARTSLLAISQLSKSLGGATTGHLRTLYRSIVLPQLDFCSDLWFRSGKHRGLCHLMSQLQRRAALLISGASRSTSLAALEFELDLMPTTHRLSRACHLTIAKAISLSSSGHPLQDRVQVALQVAEDKSKQSSQLNVLVKDFLACIPSGHDMEALHPMPEAPWTPPPKAELTVAHSKEAAARHHTKVIAGRLDRDVVLYTDGSLSENQHGGSGGILDVQSHSIPFASPGGPQTTVANEEAKAIHHGLQLLLGVPDVQQPGRLIVFSDSQAVLQAIFNTRGRPGQAWIIKIRGLLRRLAKKWPAMTTTLIWCPGHQGIEGNEIADELARQGASWSERNVDTEQTARQHHSELSRCSILNVNCIFTQAPLWSLTAIRREATQAAMAAWSSSWTSNEHGGQLRAIDPRPPGYNIFKPHTLLSRRKSRLLVWLKSGKNTLRVNSQGHDPAASPFCNCGKPESLSHFLLYCPLYARSRHDMRLQVGGRRASSIQTLLCDEAVIPLTLDFVLSTRRL